MAFVVYKITNNINGKVYIGITKNIKNRMREHRVAKDNYYIHNAIRGDGWDNFSVNIIDSAMFPEMADELERKYISEYNCMFPNGYNLTAGGNYGWRQTPESIEKIRRAKIGKKQTPESNKKRSMSLKGRTRQPFTIEHRMKISQSRLGIKPSNETRNKLSLKRTGKKHSPETCEKIRLSKIGKKRKPFSKIWKNKISESLMVAYANNIRKNQYMPKQDPQTGKFIKEKNIMEETNG